MSKFVKKTLSVILSLGLVFSLAGCVSQSGETASNSSESAPSVAATSVAICEILDKLEYDNVVGVPETERDLPERYGSVATIGAPMTPDYEIIKSISPDIVLSPKSLESTLSADYTSAGINSAFLDLSSVQGMYSAITSLGELLGCEEQAKALTDEYEDYMKNYEKPDGDINALILMCFPDGFYLVATENSYVGNLVSLAGFNNVYGSDTSGDENGFVSVNPEDMVQKNPDVIFVFAHYSEDSAFEYMRNEFATNDAWQYYDAVKENKIYYLPSDKFGMSADLSWTDALDYLGSVTSGEGE